MDDSAKQRDAIFLASVLAASDDCIKVLALDGTLDFMSEGGQRVMEVSDVNAIKGCPWPDFWQGTGNAEAREAIAAARDGRSARFQGVADTAAGNPRYWDVQVSPILGADGRPERILSVSRDITQLKVAEERHHLLALELKHRMKNTIAMIQAIGNQTLRPGIAIEDAKASFMERLGTLSMAQDLLTRTAWEKARLHDLVDGALQPHDTGARIVIDGPDLEISSKCALALALALHELATNATKYGALSVEAGRVDVRWTIADEAGVPTIRLRWQESSGPHVSPPTRTGFGTRMIGRALSGYIRCQATLDYRPDGVVFKLVAPVEALVAE